MQENGGVFNITFGDTFNHNREGTLKDVTFMAGSSEVPFFRGKGSSTSSEGTWTWQPRILICILYPNTRRKPTIWHDDWLRQRTRKGIATCEDREPRPTKDGKALKRPLASLGEQPATRNCSAVCAFAGSACCLWVLFKEEWGKWTVSCRCLRHGRAQHVSSVVSSKSPCRFSVKV